MELECKEALLNMYHRLDNHDTNIFLDTLKAAGLKDEFEASIEAKKEKAKRIMEKLITESLKNAMGGYASMIATLVIEDVIADLEANGARLHSYNGTDLRFALGRVLFKKLGERI